MSDEKLGSVESEILTEEQTDDESIEVVKDEIDENQEISVTSEIIVAEQQDDVEVVVETLHESATNETDTGSNNETAVDMKDVEFTSAWFKLEQKVRVRSETIAEDESYETYVRDFVKEYLYLDIPKANGAFIVPAMGSKIYGSFISKNSVYIFETYIVNITRLSGIPVWVLAMPLEFRRIQRRSFLRMDVLLPVRIRVEAREGVFMPSIKTNCLDISAGGVRYVLDFPVNSGKITKLSVDDFPGIGRLEAFCKAVRSVKSAYSEENYWVGAQFVNLPYKIEDKIVRHIFKIQKRIVISSSPE